VLPIRSGDRDKARLERLVKLTGKSVFLCFTCDPFPAEVSHESTYQIIELLKEYGNSVQILTKNFPDDMARLCHLLDKHDRYGITYTEDTLDATRLEPNAAGAAKRYLKMSIIKYNTGCQTFVSCEPVVDADAVYGMIKYGDEIDQFRIGKLNYASLLPPDLRPNIDWGDFGRKAERLCKEYGRGYLIKEDLRREMGKE
jgi:DNA repair photolyase